MYRVFSYYYSLNNAVQQVLYLYIIYIVVGIRSHLEMIENVWEDYIGSMQMLHHFKEGT